MPDDNSFADLMQGDMKVWPAETPVDGDAQLRVQEGDDEMPLSSAPSGRRHEGMAGRSACGRVRTAASAGRWRWNATFVGTFSEGAWRYARENGLWTGPHSCECRKVTMKRHFRRHLLEEV